MRKVYRGLGRLLYRKRKRFSVITLPPSLKHLPVITDHLGSALAELCLRPTWGFYTESHYPPVDVGRLHYRNISHLLTYILGLRPMRGISFGEVFFLRFYVGPSQRSDLTSTWSILLCTEVHVTLRSLRATNTYGVITLQTCTEFLPNPTWGPRTVSYTHLTLPTNREV